jgi:hypothetical protein
MKLSALEIWGPPQTPGRNIGMEWPFAKQNDALQRKRKKHHPANCFLSASKHRRNFCEAERFLLLFLEKEEYF